VDKVIREGLVRVGVDLAKRVIQVHVVDAAGRVVTARALPRDRFMEWCAQLPPGCTVAMEACGGAHHWARRLATLGKAIAKALKQSAPTCEPPRSRPFAATPLVEYPLPKLTLAPAVYGAAMLCSKHRSSPIRPIRPACAVTRNRT